MSSMMGSSDCPEQTVSTSGLKIDGTVTYGGDQTYDSSLTLSGNVVLTLPASCLTRQDVTITCSQIEQSLQSSLPTSDFSSGTCLAAGGGCRCTLVLTPTTSSGDGTYTTTGAGLLTQTDSTNGTPDSSDYWVRGNTRSVSPHADSGMAGTQSASGTITLARQ
jgi:hypothetical protein